MQQPQTEKLIFTTHGYAMLVILIACNAPHVRQVSLSLGRELTGILGDEWVPADDGDR